MQSWKGVTMARRLEDRLRRLESRAKPDTTAVDAAAFDERIGRLEAHVIASGDASDDPNASPAERAVRRHLRGEAGLAEALADAAEGRWP